MKKLISFSIAVGLAVSGFSQVTFQKLFKGSGDEEARAVDVCNDGGFIIGGNTTSSGQGGNDMLIMKLDSVGNLQWGKTFGGNGNDLITAIKQTPDGGFFVKGYIDIIGANSNLYLLKLDSAGSEEWNKIIPITGSFFVYEDLIVENSTNMVMVNKIDNNINLTKVNYVNGQILYSKNLISGGNDYAHTISLCTNGDYLIGGRLANGEAIIIRVSSNGSLIWSKKYSINGAIDEIKELNNGEIIAFSNQTGIGRIILKLDSNGNILWEKQIANINEQGDALLIGSNNNIILTGLIFDGTAIPSITVLDSSGNLISYKSYPNSNNFRVIRASAIKNDRELINVGLEIGASQDIFVQKTDNYSETPCNDSVMSITINSLVDTANNQSFTIIDTIYADSTGGVLSPIVLNDTVECIEVYGCMDTSAENYNPYATISDGSCTYDGTGRNPDLGTNISIYPNPTSKDLILDFTKFKYKIYDITIYNTAGNVLYSRSKESLPAGQAGTTQDKANNNPDYYKVDVTTLGKGNHIVVIETDKGKVWKRIVISVAVDSSNSTLYV